MTYRMKNATAKWIATQNVESAKSEQTDIYNNKTATTKGLPSTGDATATRKQISSGEERSSAILSQRTFDVLTRAQPDVKTKWISEEARRVRAKKLACVKSYNRLRIQKST